MCRGGGLPIARQPPLGAVAAPRRLQTPCKKHKMFPTHCAACVRRLAHDAPRCVKCRTRYCCNLCLRWHEHRGDHDDKCEEIARGGGAEKYHADKRHEAAVTVAVAKCADDTEGQTCYICLGDGSEDGLVRMCACRGAAGFAHLSCLVRQAEILVADAEENNLGDEAFDAKWARWTKCGLCEQNHYGYVACALGWACWKTYCGRPETDETRMDAMTVLGNGLYAAENYVDTLSVREADLSMRRRVGASEEDLLVVQSNLAITYGALGRLEEASNMFRDVYSGRLRLGGEEHVETIRAASNYASMLRRLGRFEEAKTLLRKTIPVARRVLGESHEVTIKMLWIHAGVLCKDDSATLADLRKAVMTLEDAGRTARRVFGGTHPLAKGFEFHLRKLRAALAARETPSPGSP